MKEMTRFVWTIAEMKIKDKTKDEEIYWFIREKGSIGTQARAWGGGWRRPKTAADR